MKDWLAKYWIALCALFLTGLSVYLNLQNWKKQGNNLTPTAMNAVVTFLLWGALLIAIVMFLSRQKEFADRLRKPRLTEAMVDQIKKVGKLESMAGRADWLAKYLEEVWHEFLKEKKSMPNPIGIGSMPDVIEQWTDKQLWRFRIHYQSYIGSLEIIDPDCDSELVKDKFPHEGEDYLSVKRKIEAHAQIMRRRADDLLSSAKAQIPN
jgi:hypothetical protein